MKTLGLNDPFGFRWVLDKVSFLCQMNIRIYSWPRNLANICTKENICLYIFFSNIIEYLQCKNSKTSTNKCLNIFVAVKSNKYFDEWIYMSRNIQILIYIEIFLTHWFRYREFSIMDSFSKPNLQLWVFVWYYFFPPKDFSWK